MTVISQVWPLTLAWVYQTEGRPPPPNQVKSCNISPSFLTPILTPPFGWSASFLSCAAAGQRMDGLWGGSWDVTLPSGTSGAGPGTSHYHLSFNNKKKKCRRAALGCIAPQLYVVCALLVDYFVSSPCSTYKWSGPPRFASYIQIHYLCLPPL